MDLNRVILLIAGGYSIEEDNIETAQLQFRQILGDAYDEEGIQTALSDVLARGEIHDPVRLPPGALQCHWRLELTDAGEEAVRRLRQAQDRETRELVEQFKGGR